jgi:hypothetical protein
MCGFFLKISFTLHSWGEYKFQLYNSSHWNDDLFIIYMLPSKSLLLVNDFFYFPKRYTDIRTEALQYLPHQHIHIYTYSTFLKLLWMNFSCSMLAHFLSIIFITSYIPVHIVPTTMSFSCINYLFFYWITSINI